MTTAGNTISTPSPLSPARAGSTRKEPMMVARAPAAPEIMPGRPPKTDVMRPMIQAEWRPTGGVIFARNANATDSGSCVRNTMLPIKNSSRTCDTRSAVDIWDQPFAAETPSTPSSTSACICAMAGAPVSDGARVTDIIWVL
jgi:hypothetical protein